jgi:16S rRNA (guanine527-N7)-methyltransferase
MEKILRDGLAALGIPAEEAQLQQLAEYGRRLLETNAVTNLTAIRDEAGVARLHFLDCAALLKAADFAGKKVIDVGSGAGFPGIPLRLLQPDMALTTVDSVGKKVEFVKGACEAMGLDNVQCLWGRMEELPQLRERYDIAVSRAVAELDVLSELCLPQVRVGGLFIAMKGPDCQDEVTQADFAIKALGGRVRDIYRYTIPGTDVTHAAVLVEKVKPTPPQYPRRYAQIKKKPLKG